MVYKQTPKEGRYRVIAILIIQYSKKRNQRKGWNR